MNVVSLVGAGDNPVALQRLRQYVVESASLIRLTVGSSLFHTKATHPPLPLQLLHPVWSCGQTVAVADSKSPGYAGAFLHVLREVVRIN